MVSHNVSSFVVRKWNLKLSEWPNFCLIFNICPSTEVVFSFEPAQQSCFWATQARGPHTSAKSLDRSTNTTTRNSIQTVCQWQMCRRFTCKTKLNFHRMLPWIRPSVEAARSQSRPTTVQVLLTDAKRTQTHNSAIEAFKLQLAIGILWYSLRTPMQHSLTCAWFGSSMNFWGWFTPLKLGKFLQQEVLTSAGCSF